MYRIYLIYSIFVAFAFFDFCFIFALLGCFARSRATKALPLETAIFREKSSKALLEKSANFITKKPTLNLAKFTLVKFI
ncbi:MAG: hypothetical protein R3Y27_01980 [Clostridia bacterium]